MSSGPTETGVETPDAGPGGSVANVTCLGCGCFCDDLVVSLERGRVTEVRSACEIGREWLLARDREEYGSPALVEGRSVGLAEAIMRAASLLSGARSPLVWGLTRTTTEAVRSALDLADALKARVVLDRSPPDLGRVSAYQEQGRVTATLGEVKNRADLVVFWGVDPLTTHPRHWERYSVLPRGRFVPEGRAGRRVVVVGHEPNPSSMQADAFVRVPVGRQIEALTALRMILRGRSIDRRRNSFAGGPDLSDLEELAAQMKRARYGAMFFQPGETSLARKALAWDLVSRLVRELNDVTRFVILGMGTAGNLNGAESALTWQSGYLQGVDYRLGRPVPVDEHVSLVETLRLREADAILVVSDRMPNGLDEEASAVLTSIPSVVIGPRASELREPAPTVAMSTSTAGFDSPGTVVRPDGVTLPLRPVVPARLPGEQDILKNIADAVKGRSAGAS